MERYSRHSILQNVREHLPGHWELAGGACCMNHEVSVRSFRCSFPQNSERLTIDSSVDVLRVGHVILEQSSVSLHIEQLKEI